MNATITTTKTTFSKKQLEAIRQEWMVCYGENIQQEYPGFWKRIAGTKKPTVLTYDDWLERYTPIKNIHVDDAPYDGTMFETYAEELKTVQTVDKKTVWTIIEAEGNQYVVAGYHFVNRIGYFITAEPCKAKDKKNDFLID